MVEYRRACPRCGGPLILEHCVEETSRSVTRTSFEGRGWGVWRYRELLPKIDERNIVSLGEGGTALLKCERLGRKLGLRRLFIKDECTNPTGSFLDRGMTLDVSRAKELGLRSLACEAVSGNFAASASAYASRAGFECVIQLPRKKIEMLDLGKLYQIIAYGADVIVEDKSTDVLASDVLSNRSYTLSQVNPYFAEGERTTAYEICEQLSWGTPDRIIAPMGHGQHLSMIWRGIEGLRALGLVKDEDVAMTGVQVGAYAGIVDRLQGARSKAESDRLKTVALDLAMMTPTYGEMAIQSIRKSRGNAVKVGDSEVLDAMASLARSEGVFAEPAAASTVAGLRKLIEEGHVDKDEEVVCVITGAGLKDPSTARRFVKKVKAVDSILSQIENRRFTTRLGRTKLEIMKILLGTEGYGYGIWMVLKQREGLRIDISSVYQHLSELEKVGLIERTRVESVLGKPQRHYYLLTNKGKAILRPTLPDKARSN